MNLLRRRSKRAEQRFRDLINDGDVPMFPNVVAEAIQQVSAPDVDLGELAETVSADPKLTVSILKLANSPAFAPRSPITSVHQAAVLLGRNQLESLLITTGVANVVPNQSSPTYSPEAFWKAAAHRAPAAAAMAAHIDPATRYDQFTAALLQDMAQPILLLHDPEYGAFVQTAASSHAELAILEEDSLGWTHSHMGELLCEEWGLPDTLTASVAGHHGAAEPGMEIAQWAAFVDGPETDFDLLVKEAQQRLGVGEDIVTLVLEEAAQRSAEIASVFH